GKGEPTRRVKSGLRPDFTRLKKLPAPGGGVGGGGNPNMQSPCMARLHQQIEKGAVVNGVLGFGHNARMGVGVGAGDRGRG
ncbi:MAG: hypothetical protein KA314_22495, partial [Chloroflexi bacterium]|nr:hypothetical protein [Chloroflexota bacterium]